MDADILKKCADSYGKLLNIQYNIIVGRKGKTHNISLIFQKENFHHILGLHKILNNNFLRTASRTKIYDSVLKGEFTYEQIKGSSYFNEMCNRIEPFIELEKLLDSDNIFFNFNEKNATYSIIKAEYLVSSIMKSEDIYIFIDRIKDSDKYFCRSFFPRGNRDYTKGQSKLALLYKEKLNLLTGEKIVQCNRFTPK